MISVSKLNKNELRIHSFKIESSCIRERKSVISIETNEILNYLKAREHDVFLLLKYKGKNVKDLYDELKYIKLPKRSYGTVIIFRGNDDTSIHDMMKAQEAIGSIVDCKEWNPLLGWIFDEAADDIEIQFITKVYDSAQLNDKATFDSLMEVVFDELDTKEDKSFCESLRKVKWNFLNDNTLEFQMQGMTRSSFIMSLKKNEIEKSIYEYTGKKLNLRILGRE